MDNGKQLVGILLILVIVTLMACAPQAVPAPAPQAQSPVAQAPAVTRQTAAPAAPARQAWQEEWEKTLVAAKREGRVVVLGSSGPELRAALAKVAALQGLSAELISGKGAELLAKIGA